jgi:hypothetical protein
MEQQLQHLHTFLNIFNNPQMNALGLPAFLFLLLISLAAALFISFLYVLCYQSRATGSQIHRAFPLLGISITALFICIQFSLPLSLGLLGALSIVRFRTPIKEPEEVGFIMLVIASSIACATFNLAFLGILLLTATLALLLLTFGPRLLKQPLNSGLLLINLSEADFQSKGDELLRYFEITLPAGQVESLVTTEGQTTLTYRFHRLPKQMSISQLQTAIKERMGTRPVQLSFTRLGAL